VRHRLAQIPTSKTASCTSLPMNMYTYNSPSATRGRRIPHGCSEGSLMEGAGGIRGRADCRIGRLIHSWRPTRAGREKRKIETAFVPE